MSPTCPRSEVLCDIARCAADRLLSVGGGGDAGPARPRQPFCGRCGRPGTSGSPAGPGWLPTRAGSTPATTRSCAVLRTSSCSTPTTPTNDADTAAGLTVDVTPAATSRCKPDAPRTGRRRRAEHRAAGRHHPHPRDLPEPTSSSSSSDPPRTSARPSGYRHRPAPPGPGPPPRGSAPPQKARNRRTTALRADSVRRDKPNSIAAVAAQSS